MGFFSVSIAALCAFFTLVSANQPPNIVYILFDDLGWGDVSYNGGQIPTPHMDNLFNTGVNLRRHYIHLICSISRSQILTGRYAMYSGYGKMNPFNIGRVGGLPMGLPTFPEWLQSYNSDYTTYAVGKWHLGYITESQLPMHRGFDHHMGAWCGGIDYTGYRSFQKCDACLPDIIDLHDDNGDYIPARTITNTLYDYRDQVDKYLDMEKEKDTPFYMYLALQSPHGPTAHVDEFEEECQDLVGLTEHQLDDRLKYCGTIRLSDEVIGSVVAKLKETGKYDNTLIVLTSDNGGDAKITGCNYPFRGTKGTLFEGNQRVPTIVAGGVIPKEQRGTARESLVSGLDWTPTLMHFVGMLDKVEDKDVTWDGIDQYDMIMNGDNHQRDHVVFNVGLRDLSSTTLVFKYPKDGKTYKYSAQKAIIERPGSGRGIGWCVPDENNHNNWAMDITVYEDSDDIDGKFVFNLDDDQGEYHNLLWNMDDHVQDVIDYALSIAKPYTEHPLYAEFIGGLWRFIRDEANEHQFVNPFMSHEEYLQLINSYIDEENNKGNTISDELTKMYNEKWTPPKFKNKGEESEFVHSAILLTYNQLNGNMIMMMSFIVMATVAVIYHCWCRQNNKYTPIE